MQKLGLKPQSVAILEPPLTTQILRNWSSPEVILAITDLDDEETLQFHAIAQSRQSGAKILLVHLAGAAGSSRRPGATQGEDSDRHDPLHLAQDVLTRMTHHLRWSGVACEPIVVRGLRTDEIPPIAASCCADRILMSSPTGIGESISRSGNPIQELVGALDAPLCVVGRHFTFFPENQRSTGRVTLVLTPEVDDEIPLAFASRFAQERKSRLTLLYIFPPHSNTIRPGIATSASVALSLSRSIMREAEVLCPIEILVREGDLATEFLTHDASLPQDFVIFISPRNFLAREKQKISLRKVFTEMRCPVLLLNEHAPQPTRPSIRKWPVSEHHF